jgi:hypothetical protein
MVIDFRARRGGPRDRIDGLECLIIDASAANPLSDWEHWDIMFMLKRDERVSRRVSELGIGKVHHGHFIVTDLGKYKPIQIDGQDDLDGAGHPIDLGYYDHDQEDQSIRATKVVHPATGQELRKFLGAWKSLGKEGLAAMLVETLEAHRLETIDPDLYDNVSTITQRQLWDALKHTTITRKQD